MKKVLVVSAIIGLLLAPAAWAEDSSHSVMVSNGMAQELQIYMKELDKLQSELKTIENQVSKFEARPYFDPKGFKRQALKRLMEKKQSEYAALNQRVTELKTQSKHQRKS